MSKDDFAVILYKLLNYVYGCLKAGVEPNMHIARDSVCKCNEVYFFAVVKSAMGDGYLYGDVFGDMNGDPLCYANMLITHSGVEFLETNSKMAKVRDFLGSAFPALLESAIMATSCL